MVREAYRSSSGALTLFAASGLHTHVVTGRSQVLVGHNIILSNNYPSSLRGGSVEWAMLIL